MWRHGLRPGKTPFEHHLDMMRLLRGDSEPKLRQAPKAESERARSGRWRARSAPMALVVLPMSYGVPVAVFTIVLLGYQEWQAAMQREKHQTETQAKRDAFVSRFRAGVSERARSMVEPIRKNKK